MSRSLQTKKKVAKVNVRRVVKWRRRSNYLPYILLTLIVLGGVFFYLYSGYLHL